MTLLTLFSQRIVSNGGGGNGGGGNGGGTPTPPPFADLGGLIPISYPPIESAHPSLEEE